MARPWRALSTLLVAMMGGGVLAWGLAPPNPLDGTVRGLGSIRPSSALTQCSTEQQGLSHVQVADAMRDFVPGVLPCVPASADSPAATLELQLNVACNGGVEKVEILSSGDWPEPVVSCVVDRLVHASFPAHGLADGDVVTFPIRFRPERVSSELRAQRP